MAERDARQLNAHGAISSLIEIIELRRRIVSQSAKQLYDLTGDSIL